MASFLSSIFGSKAQTKSAIYPPENFSVLQATLANGKPAIGSFDMGYKKFDKKSQYLWYLEINVGLDLKHVDKNGLPNKDESDIANRFEDYLIAEIRKVAVLCYVGHLYNDTFLDIYAYTNDPEKVNAFLQKEVNKKGLTRGFAFKMEQDPNWTKVKQFIH